MDFNLSAILRRIFLSSFSRYFAASEVSLTLRAKASFDLSEIGQFSVLSFLSSPIKDSTDRLRLGRQIEPIG